MGIALSQTFKIINRELSHSVEARRDILVSNRYDVASILSDKIILLTRPLLEKWSPANGCLIFRIPDRIFIQVVEQTLEEIKNKDGDSIWEIIALNDLITEINLVGGDG